MHSGPPGLGEAPQFDSEADTPKRPRRNLPAPRLVAEYWRGVGGSFLVDPECPQCFCCGRTSSDWRDFDRAHLVDRQVGGLDNAANIVMLCPRPCHSLMPIFEIDEWDKAIQWVLQAGWIDDLKDDLIEMDADLADEPLLMWRIAGWLLSAPSVQVSREVQRQRNDLIRQLIDEDLMRTA